jgi:uncharacterized protein involved in exopolysaccharide biosynthesis
MNTNEFSPYLYFNHRIGLWWLVALAAMLGGIFGFIFYQLHPPIYEATATYIVTIDLYRFPIQDIREDMLQYNEDLALNTTKAILLLPEVRDEVVARLNNQGFSITSTELVKNYTIERKHDSWELRYRSEDPVVAQTVANIWAEIGYQAMLSRQAAGDAPDYVVFQPPSPAMLPTEPVLYDRNRLVLAGVVIGFISGILTSGLTSRSSRKASLDA